MEKAKKEKLQKLFLRSKYQLELESHTVTKEDETVMKGLYTGELSREEVIRKLKG